jgi:hypothetical protein
MNTPNSPQSFTLQLTQADVQNLANVGGGSISFGPLTLSWDFTLSPLSITVTLKLLGITIASGSLNPSNPTITLGGSAGGFTAEVTLTLNPSVPSMDYHVEVSAPIVGKIIDKSGTINL